VAAAGLAVQGSMRLELLLALGASVLHLLLVVRLLLVLGAAVHQTKRALQQVDLVGVVQDSLLLLELQRMVQSTQVVVVVL
jgi:hypothetical protein